MMDNTPDIWMNAFPVPDYASHKYNRGQVYVLGGAEMTGAACLAAHSASRIGAGLITIVSPKSDYALDTADFNPTLIYRSFMPHIIVREGMGFLDYLRRGASKGTCASIIGCGLGLEKQDISLTLVQDVLRTGEPLVLDADGLSIFEMQQESLFQNLHQATVITPHEGEFVKLFPDLKERIKADRVIAAREAASRIAGVLVLKGAQTIIAMRGRDIVINKMASPYLATAGTGDVLAGLIGGLLAQKMPAFEAACAAVYLHGRAAQIFGAGLIASDIPDLIPKTLQELLGFQEKVS